MYERLLLAAKVNDFQALEEAWKANWKDAALAEEIEQLWEVEEEWDQFLATVDQVDF